MDSGDSDYEDSVYEDSGSEQEDETMAVELEEDEDFRTTNSFTVSFI